MDEGFSPNKPCTINADFKVKSMTIDESSSAQITIWDTCGQERYRSMTGRYFKGAHGIILVYDVADKRSFGDLDIWLEEIKKNTIKEDLSIILVGRKSFLMLSMTFLMSDTFSCSLASLSLAFSLFLEPFFFLERLLCSLFILFSCRDSVFGFGYISESEVVYRDLSPASSPILPPSLGRISYSSST